MLLKVVVYVVVIARVVSPNENMLCIPNQQDSEKINCLFRGTPGPRGDRGDKGDKGEPIGSDILFRYENIKGKTIR